MATNRNRLRKLAEQFDAIPKQKELKQTKIQFSTIAEKVGEKTDSLLKSFGQVEMLREVQEQQDLLKAEIDQQLKTLRAIAQTLDQQVSEGVVASKITSSLDSLSKVAKVVSETIAQSWASADHEIVETSQALIELTGKYDVTSQLALQKALAKFKSVGSPSGQVSIIDYRNARDALLQARTKLNIPGAVGEFLNDAVRGAGSIKAFSDPEVQTFLNDHPALWTRLTVRLA
jgi:hypothetical protein